MSYTMTETGAVLTETQEGVTMPADYRFASVNDYVHGVDRYFEELQWLALGMATEIEKLQRHIAEIGESMRTKATNNPDGVKASTLELLGDDLLAALPSNA